VPACSGTVCNSTSGTIDSNLTMSAGHKLKVFGRYDSGWVYFNRTRDLAAYICEGH
jgi:glyceraldehyde-3-phosphate dehydrogenase/erythrose-4-phosphate dehydrogenase